MLQIDSIVTDLMFQSSASIDQQTLIEGLGGEEVLATKQLLDVDRLDPRAEMELSPSMPFRRRGERRLMIIDDQATTPREDPTTDPMIKADLRPFKEALINTCSKLPIRLGRIFALGAWSDAVIVARSVRDLRAIALLPWALDPHVDIDGKRRQTPLSQKEFEGKLVAYEKRLDELDEQQILARITGATFERRGELCVLDVLEPDGTWDQRKSIVLEQQLGAWDSFSLLPGAPSTTAVKAPEPPKDATKDATKVAPAAPAKKAEAQKPAPAPVAKAHEPVPVPVPVPVKEEPKGPPLGAQEIDGKVILVFPPERFDLDVAAALGKRDWDQVVRRSDNVSGAMRDKMQRDGAVWIAPLEFLSEVFIDGKPLTKQQFEKDAQPLDGGRALEVHFPRFGDVILLEIPGKGRFVTSLTDRAERAAQLVK